MSKSMLNTIKKDVEIRKLQGLKAPSLCAISVGENTASEVYLNLKAKACKFTGINMNLIKLPSTISQESLHQEITELNNNKNVDAIIVQLPLPRSLDQYLATAKVHWSKDVDGFHPYNIGRLALGFNTFIPATVAGIITLIDNEIGIPHLKGKNICIVGRSDHICKPLQMWLQNNSLRQMPGANSTVTIVHEDTPINILFNHIKNADMVVTATNKNEIWLKGRHIKQDSIIIDVAFNRCKNTNKIYGDVDFDSCLGIAKYITPVPNGVGPITVSELVKNVLIASTESHKAIFKESFPSNYPIFGEIGNLEASHDIENENEDLSDPEFKEKDEISLKKVRIGE